MTVVRLASGWAAYLLTRGWGRACRLMDVARSTSGWGPVFLAGGDVASPRRMTRGGKKSSTGREMARPFAGPASGAASA